MSALAIDSPFPYPTWPVAFQLSGSFESGGILEVSTGPQFSAAQRLAMLQVPRARLMLLATLALKGQQADSWEQAFVRPVELARQLAKAGIGDGDLQTVYSLISECRRVFKQLLAELGSDERKPFSPLLKINLGYRLNLSREQFVLRLHNASA